MGVLGCIGLLACAGVAATSGQWLDYGDVTHLAGNGGLTVGVEPTGAVTVCRWPSPGSPNQLDAVEGLKWGIVAGDDVVWLPEASWQVTQHYEPADTAIIRTAATLPEAPLAVTREVFVHPERDVLVDTVTVRGLEQPPAMYWVADFSPCTTAISGWPVADWLSANRDFAAFTPDAGKTVHHFRPRKPGSAQWARAARLAADPATDADGSGFDPGVWAAYASANEVAGFQCGVAGARSSALEQARSKRLAGDVAAVGACNSAVALVPKATAGGFTATVLTAFGADRNEAEAALAFGLARGRDALATDTRAYWQDWLGRASLPATADPETQAVCRRGLLTIALATDRQTGAIVRSPASLPLALDWPRHGAWMTLALDMAGYHDRAEKHTRFYCDAVRDRGRRGAPMGSLPAALYADGADALPHLVLEADAGAWVLASFWRHAAWLDLAQRRAYLEGVWQTIERATAFIGHWSDGRNREPLHSFDAGAGKDLRSTSLLLTAFMGVDSALRMTDALNRSIREDWQRRRRELLGLISIHCVDFQTKQWKAADVLPFWCAEFAEMDIPSWDPVMEARQEEVDTTDPLAVAEAASDAALLWQGDPDRLEGLKPLLQPATASADALISARNFVAASLIYAAAD